MKEFLYDDLYLKPQNVRGAYVVVDEYTQYEVHKKDLDSLDNGFWRDIHSGETFDEESIFDTEIGATEHAAYLTRCCIEDNLYQLEKLSKTIERLKNERFSS